MKTEVSGSRLPNFGTTRGKTIFRFNHQEKTRKNEAGEDEIYWSCNYVLVDSTDRNTLVDAVIRAQYDRSEELSLINNLCEAIMTTPGLKDLNVEAVREYSDYQTSRTAAKAIVDAKLI